MRADNNSTETPSPSGISRRTVVAGVAWAVPAITVAGTLPAMAASGCITFTFDAGSCKDPGNPHEYHLKICVKSTCQGTVFPLKITRITNGSGSDLMTQSGGNVRSTATFNSAGCVNLTGYSNSSANNLTIYYEYGTTTGSFTIDAPPKCD